MTEAGARARRLSGVGGPEKCLHAAPKGGHSAGRSLGSLRPGLAVVRGGMVWKRALKGIWWMPWH